jgi:hypothetical protein
LRNILNKREIIEICMACKKGDVIPYLVVNSDCFSARESSNSGMERLVSRGNFPIPPHVGKFVTKRIPGATVEIKLEGSVGKLVAV